MKNLLLVFFVLLCSAVRSTAQITYHDINPDTTVNTWDRFTMVPGTSSLTDIVVWWHPSVEVVIVTDGDCELLFNTANNLPAKLEPGDVIGPSGTWLAGNYDILDSGSVGNWQTGATDKYIGFRFKNAAIWYYGWLKMTVAPGAISFTVKEWGYNSLGNSIRAGQMNISSVNTYAPGIPLAIFPNPASGSVKIKMIADEYIKLSIADMNMDTKKVLSISKGQNDPRIDVSMLPAGEYYITAEKGGNKYITRFIKQ